MERSQQAKRPQGRRVSVRLSQGAGWLGGCLTQGQVGSDDEEDLCRHLPCWVVRRAFFLREADCAVGAWYPFCTKELTYTLSIRNHWVSGR